jgi:hypothetical protein
MWHENESPIGAALKSMPHEPLLPVEKKLIGWSVGLGIALLAVLVFLARWNSS